VHGIDREQAPCEETHPQDWDDSIPVGDRRLLPRIELVTPTLVAGVDEGLDVQVKDAAWDVSHVQGLTTV